MSVSKSPTMKHEELYFSHLTHLSSMLPSLWHQYRQRNSIIFAIWVALFFDSFELYRRALKTLQFVVKLGFLSNE